MKPISNFPESIVPLLLESTEIVVVLDNGLVNEGPDLLELSDGQRIALVFGQTDQVGGDGVGKRVGVAHGLLFLKNE